MHLRPKHLWVLAASCFLHVQAGEVYGQGKRNVPGKTAPKKAAPAKKKPEPMKIPMGRQEMGACVRPRDGLHKWGFNDSGGLIESNVEHEVQKAGTKWVYVFDPRANKTVVDRFPSPFNDLRCPGDTRPPAAAAAAPAAPPAPLTAPPPRLGAGSAMSQWVERFCKAAEQFPSSSGMEGKQSKKLVARLYKAIKSSKRMKPLTSSDLSVEAAKMLFDHFKETITDAMTHRQVVAPYNVQRKFVERANPPNWKLLKLIGDDIIKRSGVGTTDTAPTVIVRRDAYDALSSAINQFTAQAQPQSMQALKAAYEKAYAGRPSWQQAIAPYFKVQEEEQAEEEEEEEEE
ncbi:MAG: hypothetical protein IPM54_32580 [Polyangiaceae bacterium]|nr:hypothetical protein [Polyangiaceae bacterium]